MGAFNYSPHRRGAEADHLPEVLLDDLLEADGGALAKDVDSCVWAEHLAESRALAYLHSLNQRFANQWDAARTTDFLERWLRIRRVPVLPTDTPVDRRAKLAAKIATDGVRGTYQVVRDLMAVVLGPVFVQLVTTSSASASAYVKGGATTQGIGGVVIPDGAPAGLNWYSTTSHILILVQQPPSYDDATFYATVGQIGQWLDDLLPAFVTWNWARDGAGGIGFFLDDPFNLDNERFD